MLTDHKTNVLIIGGGPAGLSAAIWCADLGLRPVLIERSPDLGGQLLWTHNPIVNYPGTTAGKGAELAELFALGVDRTRVEIVTGAEVVSADLTRLAAELADGREYRGDAVVIATGVRRRKLQVPGEEEFTGRGILSSGALERRSVAGKSVVIVGGGDAALENALILGEYAREIIVVHRRGEFSARGEFFQAARQRANVRFITNAVIESIDGSDRVTGVRLRSGTDHQRIGCDAVLVRIGVDPNTHLFSGQLEKDTAGYLVVDRELRTSISGVWAIGDVTGPIAMTIANAVGHGSTVAKSIVANR